MWGVVFAACAIFPFPWDACVDYVRRLKKGEREREREFTDKANYESGWSRGGMRSVNVNAEQKMFLRELCRDLVYFVLLHRFRLCLFATPCKFGVSN
jgi:hypothetical protein